MIWVLVCNNMCRCERHFGSFHHHPTIFNTMKPTAMQILFIEIQWQGIILAPMCLCQGKMWKSKVKNIFHITSHVGLLEWSHTKWYSSFSDCAITSDSSTIKIQLHLQFDVAIMYLCKVWRFMQKYEQEWRQITQSHDLRPTKYWPISPVNSDLYRRFMSACLDDLCPYSCLNPMLVHRKTYVLMFCKKKYLSAPFMAKITLDT